MPFWGTSFSAAYVSGVAALVRAKYPELTAHQVINRILQTAHNPPRGVDNQVGYGVVDPVAALTFNVPLATGLPRRADAGDHPAAPPPPRTTVPAMWRWDSPAWWRPRSSWLG
ncbi:subtilase family protein [Mycobacterium xenopi 3993]|nr:subtilase family protein [Mycobacterium xenopi 3993]